MNLIQIVEDRQVELETELRQCREVLVLLRRGRVSKSPHVGLKGGPIVYGGGHHDGKIVKNGTGSNPKPRVLEGATLRARAEIVRLLRSHPNGLTVAQMTDGVKKAGIEITDSTIHNSIRRIPLVGRDGGIGSNGHQAKIYSLTKGEN